MMTRDSVVWRQSRFQSHALIATWESGVESGWTCGLRQLARWSPVVWETSEGA